MLAQARRFRARWPYLASVQQARRSLSFAFPGDLNWSAVGYDGHSCNQIEDDHPDLRWSMPSPCSEIVVVAATTFLISNFQHSRCTFSSRSPVTIVGLFAIPPPTVGDILTLRPVGVTWRAKLIRSEEVKASIEGVTAPGTHLYAKRPPYNRVSRNM